MIGLLFNLTACSSIAGFFPDKEKDYQLSTELPPLKIPPDITGKGLTKPQPSKQLADDTETVGVIGEVVKQAPVSTSKPAEPPVVVADEQEKTDDTRVELVKFGNGETRLQINKSPAMSWRMIGKALSRKGIEITARDQANGEFRVQYDPNETDFKDESFLDEIAFVFAEDHNQTKPYQIKLLAREKTSEIVILDEQGKPAIEGGGLSLLKLLSTTIQANLADK
jgi:outer membrane protein assembly factor BamC